MKWAKALRSEGFLGSGAAVTGKVFGVERVPVGKRPVHARL